VQDLVDAGEQRIAVLEQALDQTLAAAGITRREYATIRDRDTLAELTTLDRPAVALLAVFVGTTRLIDNLLLEGRRA
jgi:pantoate--beta-alanine ligase